MKLPNIATDQVDCSIVVPFPHPAIGHGTVQMYITP